VKYAEPTASLRVMLTLAGLRNEGERISIRDDQRMACAAPQSWTDQVGQVRSSQAPSAH